MQVKKRVGGIFFQKVCCTIIRYSRVISQFCKKVSNFYILNLVIFQLQFLRIDHCEVLCECSSAQNLSFASQLQGIQIIIKYDLLPPPICKNGLTYTYVKLYYQKTVSYLVIEQKQCILWLYYEFVGQRSAIFCLLCLCNSL